MKKITSLARGLFRAASSATIKDDKKEDDKGYKFTEIVRLPTTSVKFQGRSGTCWVWATLSFLESEIIRLGKDSLSLSPMFVVWNAYHKKANRYVRMHGSFEFHRGGTLADVTSIIKEYGIVPITLFEGLQYGEITHTHEELTAIMKGYLKALVENHNKRLSTAWMKGFEGILNAYLGEIPEKFNWEGTEYTPKTFATKACGLNMDDYINLTSFTHHPFYTQFALEFPDNWIGTSYNVPLNEFIDLLDKAIDNGYTFSWGAGILNAGFSWNGIAVAAESNVNELRYDVIASWVSIPKNQQAEVLFKKPGKEKEITQELRQKEFDNYETTDDHFMHVLGKAVDQIGNKYFIVKNSWGEEFGDYKGYLYASYSYVAYKTTSVLIHKDALPEELKKKLGLQ